MGAQFILPPPSAITRLLSRFDRDQLAGFISVAIDLLDFTDGDADTEDADPAEEDDPSGQCDEDGINTARHLIQHTYGANGPGCPISDPDEEHDGREHEDWE
jgi:hypothetical protein